MNLTEKQIYLIRNLDYMFHKTDSYNSLVETADIFFEYGKGGATTLKGLERKGVIESVSIYCGGGVDLKKGKHWDFWLRKVNEYLDTKENRKELKGTF